MSISQSDCRILFLSKHERRKGLGDLLHALQGLSFDKWRLSVGGAGWNEDDEVVGIVGKLPEGAVTFLGRIENKAVGTLMQAHDIVVVPSHYENFGNVAIEAQAAGVPVLAARTGGLQDVVIDGQTGLLFEPRNIDALRAGLARLIENPGLRTELGQQAVVQAKKNYPWPVIAQQTDALLRRQIELSRRPQRG